MTHNYHAAHPTNESPCDINSIQTCPYPVQQDGAKAALGCCGKVKLSWEFLNASCHLVVLSLHHQEQAVCGLQDEVGRLGSVPYYNRRPANAASFIALVIHCTEVYLGRCLQTWVLIQILHPTQGITLGLTLYFYVIER